MCLKGSGAMKLNPDCIRDVLLTVEDNTDYLNSMRISSDSQF
jgi:hypothetical protein